jgi:uncharacterized membrane protein YccC
VWPPLDRLQLATRARAVVAGMAARRSIAVRAGTVIAVILGAGALLGDVEAGTVAALGGFAGLYGAQAPYARRARVVAAVGAGLALSAALGSLVAGSLALTVVVGGGYAALATLAAIAARVGPPREFFLVMVYLMTAQLPADPSALPARVGLVLAGAGVAWLVAMSPALLGGSRPERRAADRALACVADLADAIGGPGVAGARHQAIVAVRQAVIAADETGGTAGSAAVERVVRIEGLLEALMALDAEGAPPLDRGWGALLRGQDVGGAPPLPELPASARVIAALDRLRGAPSPGDEVPAARRSRSRWLAPNAGWTLHAPHGRIALRMGAVIAVGLASGAVGVDRPAWVALSAAAVLQGAHARVIGSRALSRAVGTVLGVVIASAAVEVSLSTAWLIAIIAILQVAVELLIVAAYGIAVVVITPLVLLLAELGGAIDLHELVRVRLADTLLGCVVAAVVVLVIRPLTPVGRLPQAQAAVMRGLGAVLDIAFDRSQPPAALARARGALQAALMDLRVAAEEVVGDAVWSDPTADIRWPITATLERAAYLALAFPPELAHVAIDRDALRRRVDAMARAIVQRPGSPAAHAALDAAPPPSLVAPTMPRIGALLGELWATLAGARGRPATSPGPPQ